MNTRRDQVKGQWLDSDLITLAVMSAGIIFLGISLQGCSTARTRNSDPVMRVAIDDVGLSAASYARLTHAVMESGKFVVVDRSNGFKAAAREQELEHTTTRFADHEKYALWKNLYGVGGIFIAVQQCRDKRSMWGTPYLECVENISLVNATTGEVFATGEVIQSTGYGIDPEWHDAIDNLIDHYPRAFVNAKNPNETLKYDDTLVQYREKTVPENAKKDTSLQKEDHVVR